MNPSGLAPPRALEHFVEDALSQRAVRWHRPHTGLSAAHRFAVGFADGSSAFVKAATDDETEVWLRAEHAVLSRLDVDFAPDVIAWIDSAEHPVLVCEDLCDARWPADRVPVRWERDEIRILFETLERVAAALPPQSLPRAEGVFLAPRWRAVADRADAFLALGLCSREGFRDALDGLLDGDARLDLHGDALVHGDVRSDNLCFRGDQMVLVDWGGAMRGSHEHDLANVLSTLPLEGGPDPYAVMPAGGAWAARHAGIAAWRACDGVARPDWLARVLRRIAALTLRWAAQSLDLPRWTGPSWREVD